MLASKTDLKGIITYCNPDFVKASGYDEEELIGQPHNLVRHPDMPPEAFADLWQTLKAGKPWTGLVKNRRKNAGYYWVLANVTPIAENGKVTGYMSVRSKPGREQIRQAETLYQQMREGRCALQIKDGSLVRKGILPAALRWLNCLGVRGRLLLLGGFFWITLLTLVGHMLLGLSENEAHAIAALKRVSAEELAANTARKAELSFKKQVQEWKNILLRGQDTASFEKYRSAFAQEGAATSLHLNALAPMVNELYQSSNDVYTAIQEHKRLQENYLEALRSFEPGKADSYLGVDKRVLGMDRELTLKIARISDAMQVHMEKNLEAYQKESQTNTTVHKQAAWGMATFILLFGGIWAYWMMLTILRLLANARSALQGMSTGNYKNTILAQANNEMGHMMNAMRSMQTKLGFDVVEVSRIANENLGVRISLDNVTTGVIIASPSGEISYTNKAMISILRSVQSTVRQRHASFDPEHLIGTHVEVLHGNSHAMLNSTQQSTVEIGERQFSVVYNPVINSAGVRLGVVMEWEDQTVEVAVQREVKGIVYAAVHGDFSMRLALEGKQGFMRELSEGINRVVETSDQGLQEVGRMLGSLANCDLTDRISNQYSGAFGQLKDDANATSEKLAVVIGQIMESTDAITAAAQQIAAGNNDLSQRTQQNAASIDQTVSSMEELTSTVRHNAENAKQANQLAIGASAVACKGGAVVEDVVATMASINESSRKIVDIISVIDGIAFQTNILALNAAVEAARAGEQGRGFAVVAGEVRNLAQRSAVAAKEIKMLIGDSVKKVEGGSKLVVQAGLTMQEIVSSIKNVTDIMAAITGASQQQSTRIEHINLSITQMDEVTQQNAALVEQAAAAAESLEQQAQNLAESVGIFKTGGRTQKPITAAPLTLPPVKRAKSQARSRQLQLR